MNKEEISAYNRDYYIRNKEKWQIRGRSSKKIAYDKKWRNENRERVNERTRKWYSENQERKQYKRAWKENNIEGVRTINNKCNAKRKALKLNANVSWVNDFFIEEMYDLAQRRTKLLGYQWDVDHIIPLQSKIVCGLHWEGNLQVIPHIDNIRKGNRLCTAQLKDDRKP